MQMKNILFVCTGSSCRSPMALGLVKDKLNNRKDIKLLSAGIIASNGLPASVNAIKVMAEIGIDISGHHTQRLTKEIVNKADMILVMTQWHKLEMIGMLDKPGKEIYLMKEFIKNRDNDDLDVQDPIGKDIVFYRNCRDEMNQAVSGIIEKILKL